MIAMISTSTAANIGPGVKFAMSEPWPSTKIHVRMPRVAPRPSAVISAALIGRISDPNARNISRPVISTSSTVISGSLLISASIESWVRVGVPATHICRPLVSMARRSLMASAAVVRSTRPADISRTAGPFSPYWPVLSPSALNFLVKPGIALAWSAIERSLPVSSWSLAS